MPTIARYWLSRDLWLGEAHAPVDDEDGGSPGAWIIQTAQPREQAEDGMGMQRPTDRPTDRGASTAAEDFAESLSEWP